MKTLFLFVTLILLSISASAAYCHGIVHSNDTIINHTSDTTAPFSPNDLTDLENDFSPGLFFIALLGIAFMVIGLGCGIAITFLAVLFIGGLVATGVLTTAILVGLYKKSLTAGFRMFLLLGSTCVGAFLGAACFWLYNNITHWWTVEYAVSIGALLGLLAGVLFGYTAYYLFQRLISYLKEKFLN